MVSIKVPDNDEITLIGDDAFKECHNLKSIEIPSKVKFIGDYAFEECTSLTSVTLPDFLEDVFAVLDINSAVVIFRNNLYICE